MIKTQELTDQHLSDVNRLVSRAFGYSGSHTYFDDFPIWKSHQVVRLGILHEQTLISHVGIHFAEIRGTSGTVPVALIGAVATDENHRGHGYSSTLMKEAIRQIEEKGCEWIFLWGSEHEFYEKLGFLLAGSQSRVLLASLPEVETHRHVQIKTGLTETIFEFLKNRETGVVLKDADREWYFSHSTVKWFYLENPFAFVAFERGMDLPHLVHEWGGDPAQLKTLLSHVLSFDPQAQLLGTHDDLIRLGAEPSNLIEEFLCLARPCQPSALWDERFWISGLNAC